MQLRCRKLDDCNRKYGGGVEKDIGLPFCFLEITYHPSVGKRGNRVENKVELGHEKVNNAAQIIKVYFSYGQYLTYLLS